MLKAIHDYFAQHIQAVGSDVITTERSVQRATASLLIEISRADFHISDAERSEIVQQIERFFALSASETAELVALAESEMENATCMFEFTREVNEHFDYEQKCAIVEMLWRVAYADNNKDKYEEHLLRRIADLIYVSPEDFVRLRSKVEV